jgi:putative transposase
LPVKRQCELLSLNRTSVYYKPQEPTAQQIEREELIKSRLDYWHTQQCCLVVRGLRTKLRKEDNLAAGRKLIRRYMNEMGIYAVYPKPNLSKRDKSHQVFPYLLKNKSIFLPNQVWAVDITYIKMGRSHMYLTVIIDWFSQFVVGWELSDSLDIAPVLEAMKQAIATYGAPAIINSDQGSHFTSNDYTDFLKLKGIRKAWTEKRGGLTMLSSNVALEVLSAKISILPNTQAQESFEKTLPVM